MTTRESPAPRPNHRWLRRGVLILIAAVAVAGGSHLAAPSSPAELAGAATAPDIAAPGATSLDGATGSGAAGGLVPPAERVAFWERRVSAAGSSPSYLDLIYLADAYLDESRASGDLDDLKRAQTALGVAAGVTPDPKAVEGRQALVAFSLHEWQEALRIANGLLAQDPQNLAALGVSGD